MPGRERFEWVRQGLRRGVFNEDRDVGMRVSPLGTELDAVPAR